MTRDISPKEAFDEAVYKHYEALHLKLQGGNAELADTIEEAAFANVPNTFWRNLVIDVAGANGALVVGSVIKALVGKALKDAAEVAALKEVEQLERQRKESQDEARIGRAAMERADRLMNG
jgi:hypothetical protein